MSASNDEGENHLAAPSRERAAARTSIESVTSHYSSSPSHGSNHGDALERYSTHQSMGPDAPVEPQDSVIEIPDEVYDRIPKHRKIIIVLLLSFCSFLAPISSTSVLAASPEVASEYNTTGDIINVSNAMYMLFMGISPMFWGPLSQVYGRRWVTLVTAVAFLGCSIGTALSPNLASFIVFRILTAFEGTSFILVGSAVIGDMYRPTERATALGWFLSGTLTGPAFGPFLGGIIVTYTSWRVIFWLQTALAGVACIGSYFILPETIYHKKMDDLAGYSGKEKTKVLWSMINPWRVIRLYRYPNLFLVGISASALLWNMYSILAAIRYVLNPRFNLTTPLQSGLFYLAPGVGYLLGTFFGGRYADFMVKKYIKKRGVRIPEDRLYSSLPFMLIIAACMLVYGWAVDKDVGGIPLAVVILFLQGFAQLFCFPSLNTYCLDVMPGRSGEVVAANYVIRYLAACISIGIVLPAINSIGIGWFSTISSFIMIFATLGTTASIIWGKKWRDKIDAKNRSRKLNQRSERGGTAFAAGAEAGARGEEVTQMQPAAIQTPQQDEKV